MDLASVLRPLVAPAHRPVWGLDELAGRLVEISAGTDTAHLTAAFGLVLDAQLRRDRAAWVTLESSTFFPPDAADGGIDLDALPVVRVPDVRLAGRAADHLARSGGFGLVVLDLSGPAGAGASLPVPLLTRLLAQVRRHDAVVVLLTRKSHDAPSMHSLVSLRAEATCAAAGGGFEVRVRVVKDKRCGPGWAHVETCRGAAGLR